NRPRLGFPLRKNSVDVAPHLRFDTELLQPDEFVFVGKPGAAGSNPRLKVLTERQLIEIGIGASHIVGKFGTAAVPSRAPLRQMFPQYLFGRRVAISAEKSRGVAGHFRVAVIQRMQSNFVEDRIEMELANAAEQAVIAGGEVAAARG